MLGSAGRRRTRPRERWLNGCSPMTSTAALHLGVHGERRQRAGGRPRSSSRELGAHRESNGSGGEVGGARGWPELNEARGGSGDEDVEAHVVCVGVELRLTWGNDGVDGAGASRHSGEAGGVRWPRRGVAALLLALGMVRKSARGRPERKQQARGKKRGSLGAVVARRGSPGRPRRRGGRRGVVAALCLQRGAWRGGEEDDRRPAGGLGRTR